MIIIFTASNTITNSTNMETFVVHPYKYQEKALRAFLEALEVPFEIKKEESLPDHVVKGIRKGQEDIKLGRSLSLDEFKLKLSSGY